ncbi:MAG: hypothetical protein KDC24_08640 [Saprospiraceae bacterium]|nr:hypothetical protein [Saprospiraceae bacterium]
MKSISLFPIFFLVVFCLQGQSKKSPDLQIGAHYWAVDFVDPGGLLSFDMPLLGKQKGQSIRYLMVNFDLGFYHKFRSHFGYNFTPGLAFRTIKIPTGRIIDVKLGIGYQRSQFDAEVYEVTADNMLIKSNDTGQNLVMPYVMFRFGKDWRFTHKKPFGWNIGVGAYGRLFVNHHVVPGLFLSGGVNYYLSSKPKAYED